MPHNVESHKRSWCFTLYVYLQFYALSAPTTFALLLKSDFFLFTFQIKIKSIYNIYCNAFDLACTYNTLCTAYMIYSIEFLFVNVATIVLNIILYLANCVYVI